jgi:predicted dehydrogenase
MRIVVVSIALLVCISCHKASTEKDETKSVRLVTLDPGHFHAALIQKSMYKNVDSIVHVYAPEGPDVQLHLERIKAFNSRKENPTHWTEEVYDAEDFFEEMLAEKAGNVVVLAGNNRKKTDYIHKSLGAGFNVLADKPMAITSEGFQTLEKAFDVAKKNNLVLYDIMTERFEITSILQKEFSMSPEIFGALEKGTPDNPAVVMNGVHYFYKYVSGNVLKRPPWFMDVSQEGNGIVDVTTHLVDLVQWECFPEQIIDYKKDIEVFKAKRWTTDMTLHEFNSITGLKNFPDYLKSIVRSDSILGIYCNGEINYRLKGVHAKVSVEWNYKASVGGDAHYSILRGTKANLVVRQGVEQQYQPTLYIEPLHTDAFYETALMEQLKKIQYKYPGIELKKMNKQWMVIIPDKYKEGHEAHFARVTENFLEYLQKGNMPGWEVPNMLAKYYTTTRALELALAK